MPEYTRLIDPATGREFILESPRYDEMSPEERALADKLRRDSKHWTHGACPYKSFEEMCEQIGANVRDLDGHEIQ